MITLAEFYAIVDALGEQASEDIDWSESCVPPVHAEQFALEAIFVICNSGMKHTVAKGIYERVRRALRLRRSASTEFGHAGKSLAIDHIWDHRHQLFADFGGCKTDADRLAFLRRLPWIGDVTQYHLAKNFGVDVAKPDVHLKRLADLHQTTPQALCEALAQETGYRVATIDVVLWRACATGILNSRTGQMKAAA